MPRKLDIFILILCIFAIFAVDYPILDSYLTGFIVGDGQAVFANVSRVIDGDTIVLSNAAQDRVRLKGINAPEKEEPYYQEAKQFLEDQILNKTLEIRYSGNTRDRYQRILAYLFIDNKNINKEIVKKGFANVYVLKKDQYSPTLRKAWDYCIKQNKNLCEHSESECSKCIKLKRLDIKYQKISFSNSCPFACNLTSWTIKDEGRKKFIFPEFVADSGQNFSVVVSKYERLDTSEIIYWKQRNFVWTASGDTLFLRDSDGKLVLWHSY